MKEEKEVLRQLAETQDAFTRWRLHVKKPGVKIPEELWSKAFDLLPHFNISRVATALKLNVTDLKYRAIAAGVLPKSMMKGRKKTAKKKEKVALPQPEPAFIELKVPGEIKEGEQSEIGKHDEGNETPGWRLEWVRRDGVRLEIQPPTFSQIQMTELVHSFLGV